LGSDATTEAVPRACAVPPCPQLVSTTALHFSFFYTHTATQPHKPHKPHKPHRHTHTPELFLQTHRHTDTQTHRHRHTDTQTHRQQKQTPEGLYDALREEPLTHRTHIYIEPE
jgi:hypothetical protein